MVIGRALGFWVALFYDLEKVGNIEGEQHRAKALIPVVLQWSAVSFLKEFR